MYSSSCGMKVCKCRVCKTGDWIAENYGRDALEQWEDEGFCLEGAAMTIPSDDNIKEFERHFDKKHLARKFCQ